MTIKARLILMISVLIAAAFLVIGAVTVTTIRGRMIDRVDRELLETPLRPGRLGVEGQGGDPDRFSRRATATLLLDGNGTVLQAIPSGFIEEPDPLPDLRGVALDARGPRIVTARAIDGSNRRYRVLLTPLTGNRYLAIAASLDNVDATTRGLLFVIGLTGLTVLVVVVGSVWLTVERGLRPLDEMVTTAGAIAAGDLSRRVDVEDATSEVGRLGQALNAMLERIEEAFAARQASERRLRQFVADASHELRTPLTSIRGYAELYRSGAAAGDEGAAQVVGRIEAEGVRMGRLVEDLLLLARLDQGRPLEREPVDLAEIVDDAVAAARAVEPARPIAWERLGEVWLAGDPGRLRQALDNLLANARVHTDPATPVTVTLEGDDTVARVVVADEGPGMTPEVAARVFDRFYRADTSRARASGGSGLGLAIVASIVEAHGGTVALETAPGRGTRATVTLPVAAGGG